MTLDGNRLSGVISPLRRALLALTTADEHLPDIPDSQIEILRALPRGTVLTPSALADRLGLGRPTISNLLGVMERAGLVARRANDLDRRKVEVLASAAALGYLDRFDERSARIIDGAGELLDADDVQRLALALPALERLRDALVSLQRGQDTASPQAHATSGAFTHPSRPTTRDPRADVLRTH